MDAEQFAPILWATMQEKSQANGLGTGPAFDDLEQETRSMLVGTAEFVLQAAGQPGQELDDPVVQGSLLLSENGAQADATVLLQAGNRVLRMDAENARSVGAMLIDAGAESIFESNVYSYMLSTGQSAEVARGLVEGLREHGRDAFAPFVPPEAGTPAETVKAQPMSREDYEAALRVLKSGEGGEAAAALARNVVNAYETAHGDGS